MNAFSHIERNADVATNTDDRLRERWVAVAGYEGLYEVSDHGRVRSFKNGVVRILKGGPSTCLMRYRRVTLRDKNNAASARYVHTLVLEAFEGPRPAGKLGLHKDGCVDNCALSNLYWGTHQQNADDRIRHGRSFAGRRNPNAVLSERQVASIRRDYSRGTADQVNLARQFGVSQAHISRIILNHSWSK